VAVAAYARAAPLGALDRTGLALLVAAALVARRLRLALRREWFLRLSLGSHAIIAHAFLLSRCTRDRAPRRVS
jgi:hypothetical protein